MKKTLTLILLALFCICGYAQTIDPVLLEEMSQHRDNEKIRVFVIMRQQYDQQQLNSRAAYYTTRAERREFVVNELKQFAETSQYDLRHSLTEMQRGDLVSEPKVLWIANALFFEATRDAILSLADRSDIMVIGFDEERNWLPDGEESQPSNPTRGITSNVTQVNANQVWNLGYTGQGVVVAVIDTGVNYNHLDLADHLWDGGAEFPYHGYDVYNNDNNPMDDHGHGTHCAGTICGDGTAGSQTGVAPDATLMCVKCLNSNGECNDSHVISAMQWAVEHGCDVISMSLGGHGHSGAEKTIVRNACVNVLNAGVIASIAAGNEGDQLYSYPIPDNVGLPGGCPPPYLDPDQQQNPGGLSCSVCVGAVDSNDGAAYFTSHGPRDWSDSDYADYPYIGGSQTEFGLIRPDVCAPGVDVISADYTNTSGYTTKSGTSMATPCVAGCMALMLSKDNNATPEDLCRILEETAVPLSAGKSNIYGYGRVDALAAINALCPLTVESFVVNDEQGNNDGELNAGESVTFNLTLLNDSDNVLDGVTLVLSTESEYVTITNGTATLPHFDAGQTQTIESIFGFTLSDGAPGNSTIRFAVETFINGEFVGYIRFEVMVVGHALRFDEVTVLNDNNGNGVLEAGETADLHVVITNIGNEQATSIVGTLSTSFSYLTINGTTGTFGTVEVNGQASADFNVTLSGNVPEIYVINLSLDLVDNNEKHTHLDFELTKGMIVFADANVKNICLSNWDTNGDGGLSYAEAAAVTSLGEVFRNNYSISSFDELQYFTGLTSIGDYAFSGCTGLTSIELSNSVTSINYRAFENCYSITSIELPNSLTRIGWYAFYNCSGLKGSLTIPNSVTSIGNSVFRGCSSLTSIELSHYVTSIDSYAFYDCSGLTSIELPSSLAYIGYEAFYNCTGLTSMVVWADSPPTFTGYPIFDNVSRIIPIYVPCDSEEAYQNAWLWNEFINIMGMCSGEVTVTINPLEGGTVTGEGYYEGGELCVLTATPNPGFSFANWTENGVVVSRDSVFSFPANLSTIVANFRSNNNNIVFADANVKALCIANWDTNDDGELSYAEAAAVSSLGSVFRGNSSITSFDELQYFIGLTSIGNSAFYNCRGLTSIQIPNSVISIDNGAFYWCDGLTSIEIPNSVTSIGGGAFGGAFYHCTGLTSIVIPNSVTSIGQSTFEYCTGLTSVVLSNSLTYIGHQAFSGTGLTSIEIPNSVTYIGTNPFLGCGLRQIIVESGNTAYDSRDNCNAIIKSSTNELITGCKNTIIPNSVTSIGVWAFCYTSLTSIEIPNSVTFIDQWAFMGCNGLTSIEIPNSVTNMGTNPFSGCSGLEQIIVDAGNTAYDSRDNCNAIINSSTNELITGCKNTVIPNSVTSIGDYAFESCTGLTSIEIPDTVTFIGYEAFFGCYNVTSISVFADNPPTLGSYAFGVNKSIPVYVLCDAAEDYQNAEGWDEFTNIVGLCSGMITVTVNPSEGGTVTGAGYYEGGDLCVLTATPSLGYFFTNWTENGITVSNDATYSFLVSSDRVLVANFCFNSTIVFADANVKALCVANWDTDGDGELSYIEAATVMSLGEVFKNNSSISTFNELQYFIGLTSIDRSAFSYCRSLSSIEIPNSVTSIGSYAFAGCTGLISIEIPSSVTSIDYWAFSSCSGLTSIEIPNSVTFIGNAAFYNCSSLTSIEIPISVANMQTNPFEGCSGLEQIIVEADNTFYDSRDNCNAIIKTGTNELVAGCKNTVIPNSVTSIGNSAFYGCSGLTVIEIHNSVASIGSTAFYGCSSLTAIEIPNSVAFINGWAFSQCTGLTSITVLADNPPTLGDYAFGNVNKSIPIYVPCGSLDAYQNASGWNEFTNIQEICTQSQTVALSQGWNWCSFNVEITLDDLKTALVEVLPSTTISIKSRSQNTTYNPNNQRWNGNVIWDLSQMYRISVAVDCEITLTGTPINPAEHPVTINNGVNWIAFPLSESMSVTNAFDGFAVNGDQIKSRHQNAQYHNNRWNGQLNTLEPGQGYIYISTTQGDRIFVYPANAK